MAELDLNSDLTNSEYHNLFTVLGQLMNEQLEVAKTFSLN